MLWKKDILLLPLTAWEESTTTEENIGAGTQTQMRDRFQKSEAPPA